MLDELNEFGRQHALITTNTQQGETSDTIGGSADPLLDWDEDAGTCRGQIREMQQRE
jgi:hypothetical protein